VEVWDDGTREVLASAPITFIDPNNHAPVANLDAWTLALGEVLDGNVLDNDSDPDGDPITARIVSISFASSEWSGLHEDGSFVYTAGAGTSITMNKQITYVAVDSHGLESAPVTSVVTILVNEEPPPTTTPGVPGAGSSSSEQSQPRGKNGPTSFHASNEKPLVCHGVRCGVFRTAFDELVTKHSSQEFDANGAS
jgi:hypothetical protein